MTRIITIIITTLLVISCSICKPLPESNTTINVRDSIVVHTIDSVIYTPHEVIKDIVPEYNILEMETSLAKSTSWLDTTTHTLKGTLENKKGTTENIKYKEKIVYRDSIQYVEKPVYVNKEVVKYKHYWYESILWLFTILSLVYIVWRIIKKKLLI